MDSFYLNKNYKHKMFFDIIIKKNHSNEIHGIISSPVFENEFKFSHLDEMILIMDKVMDMCNRPVHDDRFRIFAKNNIQIENLKMRSNENLNFNRYHSNLRNKISRSDYGFFITVSYRQYNSWQGTVLSLRNKESKSFRSALEFMNLVNSAIC